MKRVIVAALLLLGAAAVALRAPKKQPRSPSAPHAPGNERQYTLTLDVELSQPGREQPIRFSLAGDWVTTVSEARSGEMDVRCAIRNARLDGSTGSVASAHDKDIEALRRRLERPFWVTYRDDGAAVRVHFPRDVEPSDRNLLQMIVTGTQLVRGPGSAADWTALERDGAGLYLAAYQHLSDARIVKRKLKYVSVDGASGAERPNGVAVEVNGSEQRFTVDGSGQLVSFDGSDQLRVGEPFGDGGWLDIRVAIRLDGLRTAFAPALAGSLERARNDVDSSPIRTHAPDPEVVRALRDARLLDGRSTESLLTAAEAKAHDASLPSRLAALFRRRPEAIARAVALVVQQDGLPLVTDALGTAATTAALAALEQLSHDRSAAPPVRVDAVTALVRVAHPTPAVMRACADLLDDSTPTVRRAARYVTGSLARAGRTDHPDEAAALDAALLARYSASRDTSERTDLLAALGNSVGPRAVPVIEQALDDRDPAVRAAAVRALRLIDDDAVDRRLALVMTSDADEHVREAALFTVGFRVARPGHDMTDFVPSVCKLATGDPIEAVRAQAVGLLRRGPRGSADIVEALVRVAGHDARAGMRRLAREALASFAQR